MRETPPPPRSGCAVITGVFLIGLGSIWLGVNVLSWIGVSPIRVGAHALSLFGRYWPLLLVAWGIFKVYQRFAHPSRASVSAAEIVILVWILVAGLAIRGAQRAMEALSSEISSDELAAAFGPELTGPAHQRSENETFEIAKTGHLTIENSRGRVAVRGSDESELHVQWTRRIHSFSTEHAERAMSAARLDYSESATDPVLRISRDADASALQTDLEIRVPRTLSVSVRNRRGVVLVADIDGEVDVVTSRGNVDIVRVASAVTATTRDARAHLRQISGNVHVENTRGDILASEIDGDAAVKCGHGATTLENVRGEVTLESAHGSIRLSDIDGAISIEGPYSEIAVERAGGGVIIESSHRPVFVSDIVGRLELTTDHARVMVRGARDDISIENSSRAIVVSEIRGSASVSSEKSIIDIDAVDGPVVVNGSHEGIRVSNFGSSLDIRASNADVHVVASRLSGTVRVETTRGDVVVALASDLSASVTAATRDGELRSDFLDFSMTENGRDREWTGTLGAADHTVDVTTTLGDISFARIER